MNKLSAQAMANLRTMRKARGMTQSALAEAITRQGHVWDRSIVANIEAGRRADLTVDELAAVAVVFGIQHPWQLTEPVFPCETCAGQPPVGFACMSCGKITL